mmetsp:Transcript_37179/g.100496  ORF Transcript_37179/g.100496 Transcript_37179/m.100496 type:complete len:208 (+) Transcript_37179:1975-2598(+)
MAVAERSVHTEPIEILLFLLLRELLREQLAHGRPPISRRERLGQIKVHHVAVGRAPLAVLACVINPLSVVLLVPGRERHHQVGVHRVVPRPPLAQSLERRDRPFECDGLLGMYKALPGRIGTFEHSTSFGGSPHEWANHVHSGRRSPAAGSIVGTVGRSLWPSPVLGPAEARCRRDFDTTVRLLDRRPTKYAWSSLTSREGAGQLLR